MRRASIAAVLLASAPAWAAPAAPQWRGKLDDTGADVCVDAAGHPLASCVGTGQDGEFGRDARYRFAKDGRAGFRFKRICGSGEPAGEGQCPRVPHLGPGPNDWACTADLVTGHIWEVKTADGTLRDGRNAYTRNAPGRIGAPDDLSGYLPAVNGAALCGASDWRVPSESELASLVDYGRAAPGPLIDAAHFPNTAAAPYWTTSFNDRLAPPPNWWSVSFADAAFASYENFVPVRAMLVRTAPPPAGARFVLSADGGIVKDTWTRLEWRACLEGEVPTGGGACAPGALRLDWPAALARAQAAGDRWRLPNIKELNSLADRNRVAPPLIAYPFPLASTLQPWWSSTPVAGSAPAAWSIDYWLGLAPPSTGTAVLRLVRHARSEKSASLSAPRPAAAAVRSADRRSSRRPAGS